MYIKESMTAGAARAPPGLLGHDQLEFTRRKSLGPAAPTTALTAAPSDGTTVTPTALKINRDDRGITVTPQEVCQQFQRNTGCLISHIGTP